MTAMTVRGKASDVYMAIGQKIIKGVIEMWKDEYSKFMGLTEKTYEEYRYGLTSHGYWIYQEEPDEESTGTLEILYLDSDDGCLIFSSENDIFGENGMQIKTIGCQWADITPKTLREITGIMSKFITARQ